MLAIAGCTLAALIPPAHARSDGTPPAAARKLDAFDDPSAWQIITADGVALKVSPETNGRNGKAFRLDYDFSRGSGYAIIRRPFDLTLAPNYRFNYAINGTGPSNTVEFKLIDPSGDNVWWVNQRDYQFPQDWTTFTLPKRKIGFAWGPSGGKPLERLGFIEIVVTSFNGGKGTVWLDDLTYEPLPEVTPYTGTPRIVVSSGEPPTLAPNGALAWRSAETDPNPTLTIDFGQARELGGMVIGWGKDAPPPPADYDVLASIDGERFTTAASVRGSNGGRDYVVTPDLTARAVRIQAVNTPSGKSVEVSSITFKPPEFADSPNTLLSAVAVDAPRGRFPRSFRGEATYWTIVGESGDEKEALISEDGAVEVDKQAFSIEPFIFENDKLLTWADATHTHTLDGGYLPIPSVRRAMPGLDLTITAFTSGAAGASTLIVRYELKNTGNTPREGTLFLALRPMQVNPSYQFLNFPGGVAPTRSMRIDHGAITVDNRIVIPLATPSAAAVVSFDNGEIVEHLATGQLPTSKNIADPRALASGALAFDFALKPGDTRTAGVLVPFHTSTNLLGEPVSDAFGNAFMNDHLASTRAWWRKQLDRVKITLPKGNERIVEAIKANLAYILINRDGPAIQPGSRSYERTWIRDGALTSTALLSLGHAVEVHQFLDWFARSQYDNGKVPCCVDKRGPDPVPEHDSHGQYIYAVRTCYAYTRDSEFLRRHWPGVRSAVGYIEFLRNQRMTDEFAKGPDDKRVLYGLMPESISHEGYSAKPMHSYWDDFWTLKGLIDAVQIAELLGEEKDAKRFIALRDSFRETLDDSLRLAMQNKSIDYLPGCAELGDFDATSTTIALSPCGLRDTLPQPQLSNSFDRAWDYFQKRRGGKIQWKDYTPYEHRLVGSMVMLGQRDRAHEMLDFYFKDECPRSESSTAGGWRMWPEVIRRDIREPAFIGDMPHTWVGSDFINSVRVMLAYERIDDQGPRALVIGAGLPRAWVEDSDGVEVQDLATEFGKLSYSVRARTEAVGNTRVVVYTIQSLEAMPPDGVIISLPDANNVTSAALNGKAVEIHNGEVRCATIPARLEVQYRAAP